MCYFPIQLKKQKDQVTNDDFFMQQVPCGKCVECRKLRINSWYVRLKSELTRSKSAHFITLTYNDESLPYNQFNKPTLHYEDIQLFFKKLRRRQERREPESAKIKYFAVGEYGSKTYRPHYHIIFFNLLDVTDVEKSWEFGHIHAGDVTDASIYYTLKYTTKSIFTDTGEDNTRLREKALMSKGLGENFLTPTMKKYLYDDVTRPIKLEGGAIIPLPRYYRDKLFNPYQIEQRSQQVGNMVEKRLEKRLDPLYKQRIEYVENKEKLKLSKTD